jgi:DMSO/TMAO reductase YedYZ heme-binding membrane subunit
MAFWTMALVSLTFYVKKWIGQTRWRKIHYLSFGVFAAAVGHGVLAGTDTNSPFAIALYITSVATVVLLTTIRILGAKEPATSTARSTAAAARAES